MPQCFHFRANQTSLHKPISVKTGGKSTHPTLKQQRWTLTSNVAGCLGRCGGVEEGCYPQQISVSLQIANPAFQRVVWASRCWSWNGGGFFSSRSLINFNFATNIFLKENFWGGLLQQEGEKSGKWSAEKYFGWVFSLVVSNQLQIGGIVPQPRLLGPFLGWWDFGAYCKKSGLYGTELDIAYVALTDQASSPLLCHLQPVLTFLLLLFFRNFSLQIFCLSLEDWG